MNLGDIGAGLTTLGQDWSRTVSYLDDKKRQEEFDEERRKEAAWAKNMQMLQQGLFKADQAYETTTTPDVEIRTPQDLAQRGGLGPRQGTTPSELTGGDPETFEFSPAMGHLALDPKQLAHSIAKGSMTLGGTGGQEVRRLREGYTSLGELGGEQIYHNPEASLDYRSHAARNALDRANAAQDRADDMTDWRTQFDIQNVREDERIRDDRQYAADREERTNRQGYDFLTRRGFAMGEYSNSEDYVTRVDMEGLGQRWDMDQARLAQAERHFNMNLLSRMNAGDPFPLEGKNWAEYAQARLAQLNRTEDGLEATPEKARANAQVVRLEYLMAGDPARGDFEHVWETEIRYRMTQDPEMSREEAEADIDADVDRLTTMDLPRYQAPTGGWRDLPGAGGNYGDSTRGSGGARLANPVGTPPMADQNDFLEALKKYTPDLSQLPENQQISILNRVEEELRRKTEQNPLGLDPSGPSGHVRRTLGISTSRSPQ